MARTLGETQLPVSPIGLGLAALGRPGYINVGHGADLAGHTALAEMKANAHAVLDAAYAGGVRYYDAARSYGEAEAFLGSWLAERGLGPDDVTVGSKWGYTYTAGWRTDAEVNEVKDLSVATLRRQRVETQELLGANLRLYQIHSVTLESGVLQDSAVREELGRLRGDHGVAIGFTVTGADQRDTIRRAVALGGFDTVQATWNLLDPSAGPALAEAREAGLGVIVKEALANGRLTDRVDHPLLAELATAHGGQDAVALAAALAQPWADVVLSGASTVSMLASNLAAGQLTLGPSELDRLGALAEDPETYWETRSALPWN